MGYGTVFAVRSSANDRGVPFVTIPKAADVSAGIWPRSGSARGSATQKLTASGLELSVISSRDGLASIATQWLALWGKCPGASGLFLSFPWVEVWCRRYLDPKSTVLAIVVGHHRGELSMVWPLAIERHMGIRTACMIGTPVSQYSDILIDASHADHQNWMHEGWDFIKHKLAVDILHLCKVRDDSALAVWLKTLKSEASNPESAPYISLHGAKNFEAVDERFLNKDRKNRRRQRKRLGELGTVGFRRSSASSEATTSFDQAMAWKREWIAAGGHVSAAFASRQFDQFFTSLLGDGAALAGVETFELTLDGKPVAIKIAITCGNYRGMHLTAYDRAFEKCGPGALLVEDMIRAGIADGINTLDFLAPAFDYKLDWASGSVGVADHALPVTGKGKAYHAIYIRMLRPRLKKLAADGPLPVRRLIAAVAKRAGRQVPQVC